MNSEAAASSTDGDDVLENVVAAANTRGGNNQIRRDYHCMLMTQVSCIVVDR